MNSRRSFDHLIREREERCRNFQSKRFGGLQVNHQFELGRLFHGQIGRFGTLENAVDVHGGPTEQVVEVWPVGYEGRLPRASV